MCGRGERIGQAPNTPAMAKTMRCGPGSSIPAAVMPSRIMTILATRMGTIRTLEPLPASVPSEMSPMRSTGHVSSQPMKRIHGSSRPLARYRVRNGASGTAAALPYEKHSMKRIHSGSHVTLLMRQP